MIIYDYICIWDIVDSPTMIIRDTIPSHPFTFFLDTHLHVSQALGYWILAGRDYFTSLVQSIWGLLHGYVYSWKISFSRWKATQRSSQPKATLVKCHQPVSGWLIKARKSPATRASGMFPEDITDAHDNICYYQRTSAGSQLPSTASSPQQGPFSPNRCSSNG